MEWPMWMLHTMQLYEVEDLQPQETPIFYNGLQANPPNLCSGWRLYLHLPRLLIVQLFWKICSRTKAGSVHDCATKSQHCRSGTAVNRRPACKIHTWLALKYLGASTVNSSLHWYILTETIQSVQTEGLLSFWESEILIHVNAIICWVLRTLLVSHWIWG